MESALDLAKLGWQIQPICYLAHPGYDPERSDESQAQLAPLPESNDAFPRRHLQENHIPDLELQIGSTLVGITFLPTLSSLKPAPDLLDPLGPMYLGPNLPRFLNRMTPFQGDTFRRTISPN